MTTTSILRKLRPCCQEPIYFSPEGYQAKSPAWPSVFTKERPLVLGFVGKDWKRKGLMTLVDIRDALELRGHHVMIRCAGHAPEEFANRKGVRFSGFIDKHNNYSEFISFLESCDVGCLFSTAEFSSISILEYISVGRPVAGFVVDGMGDLFIPDASMRFSPEQPFDTMVDTFERFITNEEYRTSLAAGALTHCNHVRWERSVSEVLKTIRR